MKPLKDINFFSHFSVPYLVDFLIFGRFFNFFLFLTLYPCKEGTQAIVSFLLRKFFCEGIPSLLRKLACASLLRKLACASLLRKLACASLLRKFACASLLRKLACASFTFGYSCFLHKLWFLVVFTPYPKKY